jgi:hypothetical protein
MSELIVIYPKETSGAPNYEFEGAFVVIWDLDKSKFLNDPKSPIQT